MLICFYYAGIFDAGLLDIMFSYNYSHNIYQNHVINFDCCVKYFISGVSGSSDIPHNCCTIFAFCLLYPLLAWAGLSSPIVNDPALSQINLKH